jgi:hypothetical protein
MFLLSFIPTAWIELAIHSILIAGAIGLVLGTVLKNVPFISEYGAIIKGVSVLLLIAGVYFYGGIGVEKEWRAKVEDLQKKIAEAEVKSEQVNTVIQTKVVEKIKVVKETRDANIQIVEKVVTKYDNMCTLSNAAIVLHDSASKNVVSSSTGAAVEGTSNVKASDLIRTVTDNYGTYYQVREQLLGWQEWYKEQKKVYEGVK